MNKKKLSLILIFTAVFSSFFLFGCKVEKIQFYRESQAQNLIDKFQNKKPQVKKSSGMIILKDEPNDNFNIRFGPSDINFDLPAKF